MINFPRQIGLLYSDATRELGEVVSYKLFTETGIVLNQLTIGLGDSETAMYGNRDIELTTTLVYDETNLTHIRLQSDDVGVLNDGIDVTVDKNIGQLFDVVRLGVHLVGECALFDDPDKSIIEEVEMRW